MSPLRPAYIAALALSIALAAQAGAWGDGTLENDAAQDWLAECARSTDSALVSEAIEMALASSYLDADDGSAAVAAAEVIAGAIERRSAAGAKVQAVPCLAGTPPEALRTLALHARQALARVANPKVSELAQLWAEDSKAQRWSANLARLAGRLAARPAP